MNDLDVSLQTAQQAFGQLQQLGVDEEFILKVRRGEDEHAITCAKKLVDQVVKHYFSVDPDASPEQVALREMWMKNPVGISRPGR